MATRNDLFPSKHLNAADLKGPTILKIDRVEQEVLEANGQRKVKPVVYFAGTPKMLVCNKTNFDLIAAIAGEDTEDWPGCEIEVYPTRTELRGQSVPCIRARAPAKARQAALQNSLSDDIPF